MKSYLILAFLFISGSLFAQDVYTKDGTYAGQKSTLVETCVKAAGRKMVDIEGIKVDSDKYCSCMVDELIPRVTHEEMQTHIEKDDLIEFILSGERLDILMECVDGNVEVEDDYQFGQNEEYRELQISIAARSCEVEAKKAMEEEGDQYMTEEQVISYCYCAVTKLMDNGYTYGELDSLDFEDSEIFNELVMPCLMDAMNLDSLDMYDYSAITGGEAVEEVPAMRTASGKYAVDLTIGDFTNQFEIDTNYFDMVIDSRMEQMYLDAGVLSEANYFSEEEIILPNGSTVVCFIVEFDEIQIGAYTVHNVSAAIIDGINPTIGWSLMFEFLFWEIDEQRNVLILEK